MEHKKTKIVLDADVIIHFMEANYFSILPDIFPEYEYLILDVVYNEISQNSGTKDFIDKYLHFFPKLKKEVLYYAKLMDEKGLVNTLEGNLSILDRETGKMYITPSGTRKRFLNEDKIAVVNTENGEQIEGTVKKSSEILLHEAALKARPDCNAAAHIHAPYLTAYAYCGKDIKLKCSTTFSLVFEEIPCLPYGLPGTIHIADGIEDAIKDHDLILLGNHGCIAVGKTLEDAVKIIEAAEEVLKIYHLTKEIGPVRNISDSDLEELYNNHPGSRRNRYGK